MVRTRLSALVVRPLVNGPHGPDNLPLVSRTKLVADDGQERTTSFAESRICRLGIAPQGGNPFRIVWLP